MVPHVSVDLTEQLTNAQGEIVQPAEQAKPTEPLGKGPAPR